MSSAKKKERKKKAGQLNWAMKKRSKKGKDVILTGHPTTASRTQERKKGRSLPSTGKDKRRRSLQSQRQAAGQGGEGMNQTDQKGGNFPGASSGIKGRGEGRKTIFPRLSFKKEN